MTDGRAQRPVNGYSSGSCLHAKALSRKDEKGKEEGT